MGENGADDRFSLRNTLQMTTGATKPITRGTDRPAVMRRLASIAVVSAVLVLTWTSGASLLREAARSAEHARAGLSQDSITVDDHDIAFLSGGSGEEMLLIHGFNADKDNWTRLAAHLTDTVACTAVDLPGHGESSRLDAASYDISSQVDRLKRIHDRLGLGAVHLVGNSMGGHIATVYAVRHPADVASLILLAPAGVTSPERSELSRRLAAGDHPLMPSNAEEYDELLAFVFVEPPYMPGVVKTHFATAAVRNRPFTDKIWGDLGAAPLPLEPLLSEVKVPTYVLWGDHDRVLDPSGSTVFAAGIEGSKVEILDACGHAPMIEHPDEVARRIRAFIGSL